MSSSLVPHYITAGITGYIVGVFNAGIGCDKRVLIIRGENI